MFMGPGFGFIGLWSLFMALFFFGGIALLILWALRTVPWRYGGPPVAGHQDPAMDILRRRFAAGEIDAEEFERRRSLLQGGPPVPAATPVPPASST